MINVNVKLFSVLRNCVDAYDPERGVDIQLSDGAVVVDLIRQLGIPGDKSPVISCDGRILQQDAPLANGSVLQIFQPVAGG